MFAATHLWTFLTLNDSWWFACQNACPNVNKQVGVFDAKPRPQSDTKPQGEVTIWRGTWALRVCLWSRWCSRAPDKRRGQRGRRPAHHVTAGRLCRSAAATVKQRDEGTPSQKEQPSVSTHCFCFRLFFLKDSRLLWNRRNFLSSSLFTFEGTVKPPSKTPQICKHAHVISRVLMPVTRNTLLSILCLGLIINDSAIWIIEKITSLSLKSLLRENEIHCVNVHQNKLNTQRGTQT